MLTQNSLINKDLTEHSTEGADTAYTAETLITEFGPGLVDIYEVKLRRDILAELPSSYEEARDLAYQGMGNISVIPGLSTANLGRVLTELKAEYAAQTKKLVIAFNAEWRPEGSDRRDVQLIKKTPLRGVLL